MVSCKFINPVEILLFNQSTQDHSNHENAENIYKGLFGAYQIVDPKQDKALGLPADPKYDIPLMFSAHYFTKNGDLTDESNERASIYGDTWLINGKIQPYLDVEPRKYRFRVVNGAASRTLNLTIDSAGASVGMNIIASDGGLRQAPATTKSLITGMGERWEVSL
jgi:bilirubin oxidase